MSFMVIHPLLSGFDTLRHLPDYLWDGRRKKLLLAQHPLAIHAISHPCIIPGRISGFGDTRQPPTGLVPVEANVNRHPRTT